MRASRDLNGPEAATIESPGWIHCFAALTGVALLVGPMLAVLWPR